MWENEKSTTKKLENLFGDKHWKDDMTERLDKFYHATGILSSMSEDGSIWWLKVSQNSIGHRSPRIWQHHQRATIVQECEWIPAVQVMCLCWEVEEKVLPQMCLICALWTWWGPLDVWMSRMSFLDAINRKANHWRDFETQFEKPRHRQFITLSPQGACDPSLLRVNHGAVSSFILQK